MKIEYAIDRYAMEAKRRLLARPGVRRGRIVNRTTGPLAEQLHERHDASDFEMKTADKPQAG